MAEGLLASNASVHRLVVRFAPFIWPKNQLPPSSAYFEASSATPQVMGGIAVPRAPELILPTVAPATDVARSAQPRATAAANVLNVPLFP
jgi:hypothetical protein